jgi:hypothetical protein
MAVGMIRLVHLQLSAPSSLGLFSLSLIHLSTNSSKSAVIASNLLLGSIPRCIHIQTSIRWDIVVLPIDPRNTT